MISTTEPPGGAFSSSPPRSTVKFTRPARRHSAPGMSVGNVVAGSDRQLGLVGDLAGLRAAPGPSIWATARRRRDEQQHRSRARRTAASAARRGCERAFGGRSRVQARRSDHSRSTSIKLIPGGVVPRRGRPATTSCRRFVVICRRLGFGRQQILAFGEHFDRLVVGGDEQRPIADLEQRDGRRPRELLTGAHLDRALALVRRPMPSPNPLPRLATQVSATISPRTMAREKIRRSPSQSTDMSANTATSDDIRGCPPPGRGSR